MPGMAGTEEERMTLVFAAGHSRPPCTIPTHHSCEPRAGTSEDAAETIQEIRRIKPAAVIVDAANATQPYLTELGATGCLVVSIDHLASARFPSQLVINPLLAPGRDAYEFCPGTQLLL